MPKSRSIFSLIVFLMLLANILLFTCYAEAPIKILTAYTTSSSADSTLITDLLDLSKEGLWKPQTKDSGSNEGIYFQFVTPVLLDWIEVKAKGGAKKCNLDFYLDGKSNVLKKTKTDSDEDENRVEYWVSYKDIGADRLFSLGARKGYSSEYAPLNVKVKAVYIKISNAQSVPQIASIRFFRKGSKEPIPVEIPKFITGKVKASSTLTPESAYGIHNLFDSKNDFAWATNGKVTDGIGAEINIQFDQPQDLSGLAIWNGYQRSQTHYNANARPAKILVKINDQTEIPISLQDKMDVQKLRFPEVYANCQTLSLKVTAIYKGASYKDMVVSELEFLDRNGDPTVFSIPQVQIEVSNKLVENLLDISLAPCMLGILRVDPQNEYATGFDMAYDYPYRSFRLRSNGSFVGYFDEGVIAEGNWEPLPDGVQIFGKKYVTYYDDSIYLQSTKRNPETKIFQDTIKVIDPAKIPYLEAKKHLKTLLSERGFYEMFPKKPGPYVWWLGIKPFYKVKITGKNEEELLKACYDKAVANKAYLLVSPLFIDLLMPSEQVEQSYGVY